MKTILQFVAISVSTLFITGCVVLTPLYNIDDHTIRQGLSEQQVKKAIHEGIEASEWTIKNEVPGKILASYTHRVHTIAVNIRYTEKNYSIDYAYSRNMKVHCTDNHQGEIFLTGWPKETCDGAQPTMIHKVYNKWVGRLRSEIKAALP